MFPLLEEAGLETWAVDILGWGFSDLGMLSLFVFFPFFPLTFLKFQLGIQV